MSRSLLVLTLVLGAALAASPPASAQSVNEFVRHECERSALAYFRDFEAGTNTSVTRPTNRTYRVVGQIFLENAVRDFACTFASDGRTMTQFSANGLVENAYLPGVGASRQVKVRFGPGSSQSVVTASVAGGHSVRYLLSARARQSLYTRVEGSGLSYRILNPDSTTLLNTTPVSREFRGKLRQAGSYVIEVINGGSAPRYFSITFGVGSGRPPTQLPGGAATQLPGQLPGGTATQLPGGGRIAFEDLRGWHAGRAIDEMRIRGFANVDSITSGSTLYEIFYQRGTRQCVQMTTENGRVQDIRDIRTHPRCR